LAANIKMFYLLYTVITPFIIPMIFRSECINPKSPCRRKFQIS